MPPDKQGEAGEIVAEEERSERQSGYSTEADNQADHSTHAQAPKQPLPPMSPQSPQLEGGRGRPSQVGRAAAHRRVLRRMLARLTKLPPSTRPKPATSARESPPTQQPRQDLPIRQQQPKQLPPSLPLWPTLLPPPPLQPSSDSDSPPMPISPQPPGMPAGSLLRPVALRPPATAAVHTLSALRAAGHRGAAGAEATSTSLACSPLMSSFAEWGTWAALVEKRAKAGEGARGSESSLGVGGCGGPPSLAEPLWLREAMALGAEALCGSDGGQGGQVGLSSVAPRRARPWARFFQSLLSLFSFMTLRAIPFLFAQRAHRTLASPGALSSAPRPHGSSTLAAHCHATARACRHACPSMGFLQAQEPRVLVLCRGAHRSSTLAAHGHRGGRCAVPPRLVTPRMECGRLPPRRQGTEPRYCRRWLPWSAGLSNDAAATSGLFHWPSLAGTRRHRRCHRGRRRRRRRRRLCRA